MDKMGNKKLNSKKSTFLCMGCRLDLKSTKLNVFILCSYYNSAKVVKQKENQLEDKDFYILMGKYTLSCYRSY